MALPLSRIGNELTPAEPSELIDTAGYVLQLDARLTQLTHTVTQRPEDRDPGRLDAQTDMGPVAVAKQEYLLPGIRSGGRMIYPSSNASERT